MSLKYEPASEPLHISVKQLFPKSLNQYIKKNALKMRNMSVLGVVAAGWLPPPEIWHEGTLQGYLAHKKPPPPRTLQ